MWHWYLRLEYFKYTWTYMLQYLLRWLFLKLHSRYDVSLFSEQKSPCISWDCAFSVSFKKANITKERSSVNAFLCSIPVPWLLYKVKKITLKSQSWQIQFQNSNAQFGVFFGFHLSSVIFPSCIVPPCCVDWYVQLRYIKVDTLRLACKHIQA